MKTTIRTLVSIICLVLTTGIANAGEDAASPVYFNFREFMKSSVNFMSGSAMNTGTLMRKMNDNRNTAKVCACEILKLRNNNDSYEQVAVFAEKTNYGDLTADYKKATHILSEERKHMKAFFFDVVEVKQKIQAPTDCISLYLSMKSGEQKTLMYDILDADIIRIKK